MIIHVVGTPAPQGSKRGFPVKRKNGTIGVALTESAGAPLKSWREDVRTAATAEAKEHGWATPPRGTPIDMAVTFYLRRPKSHYRTGANAHLLRADAPIYPTGKPDVDKLLRATLDALTSAGIYDDDSTVVHVDLRKSYAATFVGAVIHIAE